MTIEIKRHFTKPGQHPFDDVNFVMRNVTLKNSEGEVIFTEDVRAPDFWSDNALRVVVTRYFRGIPGEASELREKGVDELIIRVVDQFVKWSREYKYLDDETAATLRDELMFVLVHQMVSWNSPVWFNFGVPGEPAQGHACLPFDARVNTNCGMIPIGEIVRRAGKDKKFREELRIYNGTGGNSGLVAAVCNGKRKLMYLELADGSELKLTSDHVVFVRQGGDIVEKQAGDVEIGEKLILTRRCIPATTSEATKKSGEKVSVSEAYLSGLMVGDGYCGQTASMTSPTCEFKLSSEALARTALKKLEDVGIHPVVHESGGAYAVRHHGAVSKAFWDDLDLWGRAYNKIVPEWVFRGSVEIVAAFLKGLFDADGSVALQDNKRAYIRLVNTSYNVIDSTRKLLRSLGIFSSETSFEDDSERDGYNRKTCFTLTIADEVSANMFARMIGFEDPAKWSKLRDRRDAKTASQSRKAELKVVGRRRGGSELVYDLQTESGDFFVEGIRVHNCYILRIDDTMIYEPGKKWIQGEQMKLWPTSISMNTVRESHIFSLGSGVGAAMEGLRSSRETISAGGYASGPVSFMMAYDAWANIIKSGGKTRRAAVMRTLADWHLDLWHGNWDGQDFISCKPFAEHMAKHLIQIGYSHHMDGAVYKSLPLQNCNISVRASDAFMDAVEKDEAWTLHGTKTRDTAAIFQAREIFEGICRGTWECGDPGIQFDDTINRWHTCPTDGRIRSSNPCAEYLFLDDTCCNLASLNLIKFVRRNGGRWVFESADFLHTLRLIYLTQDLFLDPCAYPDEIIKDKSLQYRTIGLGYGNLGATLMKMGMAYDSDEGRAFAGAVTALMHFGAWDFSADLAEELGAFPRYEANEEAVQIVLGKHRQSLEDTMDKLPTDCLPIVRDICDSANILGAKCQHRPVRNAQMTLLAPTGTISYLMDFGSTSFEPFVALREFKTLSGGGTILRVVPELDNALTELGYTEQDRGEIVHYIADRGYVTGAPKLREEHYNIFDCALPSLDDPDQRSIHFMGHVRMMAAVQPFLSGSMSKTINCPEDTTIEQIGEIYKWAWKARLKCVSIFRDNSKGTAATGTKLRTDIGLRHAPPLENETPPPVRRKLPDTVHSIRKRMQVGKVEGYIHVGLYPDGTPGEIFIRTSNLGDTVNGFAEALAMITSVAIQYGVPLPVLLNKLEKLQFPPNGMTQPIDHHFCPQAKSIPHYMAAFIRNEFNIHDEFTESVDKMVEEEAKRSGLTITRRTKSGRASIRECITCHEDMAMISANCHYCENCYHSEGTCAM